MKLSSKDLTIGLVSLVIGLGAGGAFAYYGPPASDPAHLASLIQGLSSDQRRTLMTSGRTGNGQGGNFGGNGGARRGAGGPGGFVSGDVLSKSDTGITVKLRDGSSRIILISGSTEVLKSDKGTIADVSVGNSVTVSGSDNPDGSVTAQTVQIRPVPPSPPKAGLDSSN